VVIDGTLIPVDRVAADRPFYSGKHRKHGMNLQAIDSPDGEILWVSGVLPGSAHDLPCVRIWGIVRELAASGLIVLADKGYIGAGSTSSPATGGGESQPHRRSPTALTRSCGHPPNARISTWPILFEPLPAADSSNRPRQERLNIRL
jgi:hypothetical protein